MPAILSKQDNGGRVLPPQEFLENLKVLSDFLQSPTAKGAVTPSVYAGLAGTSNSTRGMNGVLPESLLRKIKEYETITAHDYWHCKHGHKGPRPEGYKTMKHTMNLLAANFCELGTGINEGLNKQSTSARKH